MRLLKIGRNNACDIVLISDRVSALHAELTLLDNGDMLIEDKKSTNGTKINRQLLTPNTPHIVRRGDRVLLGDVELPWSKVPMQEDNSNYKNIYSIGSSSQNNICIDSPTVSRFHATLKVTKDKKYLLTDHSKNGTTVNGRMLKKNEPTFIYPNEDKIAIGRVPLNLAKYMTIKTPFNWTKLLAVAACVVILCGIGIYAWHRIGSNTQDGRVPGFSKVSDYIPATSMVVGRYFYVVSFDNDPMLSACDKYNIKDAKGNSLWPEKLFFGVDGNGDIALVDVEPHNIDYSSILGPMNGKAIEYTGTSFFVSGDGRLITNKHVAYPWRFTDEKWQKQLTGLVGEIREKLMPIDPIHSIIDSYTFNSAPDGLYKRIILAILSKDKNSGDYINACISGFRKCNYSVSGRSIYMRIAQANHNYDSYDELLPVSVTDTLENPAVDLAMLQLNTKKTPDEVKLVIDPDYSITDDSRLAPMAETYYYLGYPFGFGLNLDNKAGGLIPRLNDLKIARTSDKVNVQFQAEVFRGASGSPVVDKNGHLVAVVNKATETTEISSGILAKYVVELYNKAIGKIDK